MQLTEKHINYARIVLTILDGAGYFPKGSIKPDTPESNGIPTLPGTVRIWATAMSLIDASESNWRDAAVSIILKPKPAGGVAVGDVIAACRAVRRKNIDRIPWEMKTPPDEIPEEYHSDYRKALILTAARGENNYHSKAIEYATKIKELTA